MDIRMKFGRKVYTITDKAFVKYYSTIKIYVCEEDQSGKLTHIDMSKSQFDKLVKEGYLLKTQKVIRNSMNRIAGYIYVFDFDKLVQSDYAIKTQILYKYMYNLHSYSLTVAQYEVAEESKTYTFVGSNNTPRLSKTDIGYLKEEFSNFIVYLTEPNIERVKELIKQRLDYNLECAKSAYDRALMSYKNNVEALNKI